MKVMTGQDFERHLWSSYNNCVQFPEGSDSPIVSIDIIVGMFSLKFRISFQFQSFKYQRELRGRTCAVETHSETAA